MIWTLTCATRSTIVPFGGNRTTCCVPFPALDPRSH